MGVAEATQPGTGKWIYAFRKRLNAALLPHALPGPERRVLRGGVQPAGASLALLPPPGPLPPHLHLDPAVSSSPGQCLRGGGSWLTTCLTKCPEDFSSLTEIVLFHASLLPLTSPLRNDDQNFEHVFGTAPVLGVPAAASSIHPLNTRLLASGVASGLAL